MHVLLLAVVTKILARTDFKKLNTIPKLTLYMFEICGLVILAHLIEIQIWGFYYNLAGVIDGWEKGFYFSAVTYATIGYGDIVPPPAWRLVASIEGLTGILMCSLSGGLIFAVVSKLVEQHAKGVKDL